MKNVIVKFAAKGAVVLSLGTVGVAFAQLAFPDIPLAACPPCHTVDLTCPGSPCTCQYNGLGTPQYVCNNVK